MERVRGNSGTKVKKRKGRKNGELKAKKKGKKKFEILRQEDRRKLGNIKQKRKVNKIKSNQINILFPEISATFRIFYIVRGRLSSREQGPGKLSS